MRTPLVLSVLAATLLPAGVSSALAAQGVYYNPTNAASTTGKTVGHELFLTIGCPGRGLLDAPCPKTAQAPAPTPTPAPTPRPADSDGDGVADGRDKCPTTPAGRVVDADGCEPERDGDGDGVADSRDKCPTTAAGRKVNADGCEVDSDGDGVVDAADKCPAVAAQTADGCPPPAAPKKLVLKGVTFDNNQATLQASSYATLDEAAATLKEWGAVRVEVAGHTDSVGKDSYNLALSQRRAEAVRQYLIDKGVAADNLTARGYGESHPVADNATADGRDQNRRVELVPKQ